MVGEVREPTTSRRNREPGRVVRIPLGDGSAGFGRQLNGVLVGFYDYFAPDSEYPDLLRLVANDFAFRVPVMDYAFKRTGQWDLLDVVPLSVDEASEIYRAFKQDPISGKLSIYWSGPAKGAWGEDDATRTECDGLERAAVWDPEHVEDRLRDHREGRPNKWVESLRLRD
ncbi:Imm26 family immunity protein [Aeromicrobium ginsengisoli]|uniref:Uncharacterized protein n=1 Tax=Aeromicrobium ginsengisoli TaxID=363867 RepID=A0A5M4FH90_9ACTN|nr:Imm26 family immunity protein [Aeromicrobium ginsengisoli]KAA1399544.1 hypothetical protein ESP70_001910 [Aeromicrobium ginsengisoli]